MVEVRISRQAVEVLTSTEAPMSCTRLDTEVLSDADSGTSAARVSRIAVEVLASRPSTQSITRLDTEILSDADSGTSAIQISRQSVESLMVAPRHLSITRLDTEVLSDADSGTSAIQVSRISVECLFRRGGADPVVPLVLPDDADIFLHNWATEATLRSAYDTRISSAHTGAESRRSVVLKPAREIDVVWEDDDRTVLDRLYVKLRRLTKSRSIVPVYMDQKNILADAAALDDTISVDTTKGRWFTGARVVIVRRDYKGRVVSSSFHIISNKTDATMTFVDPLGVTVSAASDIILPLMDCETVLAAKMTKRHGCHGRIEMTLAEVAGPSALNPIKADTPSGATVFDGTPVLIFDPNWVSEVEIGRDMQGEIYTQGTTQIVAQDADRSRQTHRFMVSGDRDDTWPVLEFFDTRRGRLRSFWQIDQEFVWEVLELDAAGNFIDFEAFGDFDDFSEELLAGFVGIVMRNGDVHFREAANVQVAGAGYRVTVGPDLPVGLDAADVVRAARGRRTRFMRDELEERWFHNCYMECEVETIEVLEEKVVDL